MKFANKFMVIPYEDKKMDTKIQNKTIDAKISDIVNNNKLDQSDKVKLVNELLVQNQQKYITNILPADKSNDNNESLNESNNDSTNDNSFYDQPNNEYNETINNLKESIIQDNKLNMAPKLENTLKKLNETLNQNKKLVKNQQESNPQDNKLKITPILENTLKELNETLSGYFYLPPAFSTRNITDSNQPQNHYSLENRKKRRENQKIFRAFMDEYPNPKTLAGTKFLEKVKDSEVEKKKDKKKKLVDDNRKAIIKKKEEKLDETIHMDTNIKQDGNGWIYLKKNGKNLY